MKKTKLPCLFAAAALCLCALPVAAQTVYRCGNTYGTTPCENGKAVNTNDVRSPEEKARADAATRSDMRQADALEQKRLGDEAAAAQAREQRAKLAEAAKKKQEKLAKAEARKLAKERAQQEARHKPRKKRPDGPEFVTLVPAR